MIEFRDAEVRVLAPDAAGGSRSHQILQPVSLRLGDERVAVIGANGSGKSTLVRLINGLVEPSAGSVHVRGPDRWLDTRRDGGRVRRLVGFVFTHPAAQLVMPTALEDVALSLRRRHPRRADRDAAAAAVLERFGIAALAHRSVHTLSGGQQQLLAIASVLAADPEVLVADEPTTLLDLRNARAIAELLLGLSQRLIVATHDLELAARCDRVILVEDGAVTLDGEPERVIAEYRARA